MRRLASVVFFALCGCASFSNGPKADVQSQLVVTVQSAPPPERADAARPAAPGFGYIWVAGYWDSLDGNYVWRGGHWLQARADYEYIRARYEYDGKAWLFHRPYWKRRHAVQ